MPAKRNVYTHKINLERIRVLNNEPEKFAKTIEQIEYRGYEVETISDGRKIVIAKPGGKRDIYGMIKKEDFFVFIFAPPDKLWQITHGQIYDDLEEKSKSNPSYTIQILRALEKVYNGMELPDESLAELNSGKYTGENPEALIKAYKWIWGQEDVNYPPPAFKGREMSWEGWEKPKGRKEWVKTGSGLKDLLEGLQKSNQ